MGKERLRSYRPHSFDERKRVVGLYEAGLGSGRISKMTGIDDSMIRMWLRKYRTDGLDALRPYRRKGEVAKQTERIQRNTNDPLFAKACEAYATTLEPATSITRRFRLDYLSFVYHVKRYHPDLVQRRLRLKEECIAINQ